MYCPTSSGGHPLYTRELTTSLVEVGAGRGVSVELVACRDLDAEHRVDSYPIHAVLPRLAHRREFPNALAWFASRLAYYRRREGAFLDWLESRPDFDVVHFQEYTPWLAPAHFGRLRRRGLVLAATVHNIFGHQSHGPFHKLVRDASWRKAWRDCDVLFVHSDGLRDTLSDHLGSGHPPIAVTPHGVWREGTQGGGRSAPPGGGRPRLLAFGAIRSNKGLHVLLGALSRLPGCDLTIAGAPEHDGYLAQLRDLAGRLPPGRVELRDRHIDTEELEGLFARSRLLILPYTAFSAQSGVLYQALAHGIPVVASDIGALGESVRDWGIGEVVPPGEESALALAIVRMLDPGRHRESVEAIARVRDEQTWDRAAEATIAAYQSIVARPRRGPNRGGRAVPDRRPPDPQVACCVPAGGAS